MSTPVYFEGSPSPREKLIPYPRPVIQKPWSIIVVITFSSSKIQKAVSYPRHSLVLRLLSVSALFHILARVSGKISCAKNAHHYWRRQEGQQRGWGNGLKPWLLQKCSFCTLLEHSCDKCLILQNVNTPTTGCVKNAPYTFWNSQIFLENLSKNSWSHLPETSRISKPFWVWICFWNPKIHTDCCIITKKLCTTNGAPECPMWALAFSLRQRIFIFEQNTSCSEHLPSFQLLFPSTINQLLHKQALLAAGIVDFWWTIRGPCQWEFSFSCTQFSCFLSRGNMKYISEG